MIGDESLTGISLRKIAKGAGIGFTGTLIGMALGYLSRIIIARWLGPSDYGLISLGFAGMAIVASLSMVGLPAGIQRYISFYKGRGDKGRIKGTILSALKISFPLSIFLAIVTFFKADWISVHLFGEPDLSPVLRIFSIGIPFLTLARNFIGGTIGFQDLRYRVYVNDLFQNIFKIVAIISFLALGFGILGAAWGWVIAIVLMPFLAFYFLESRVFPVFNTKVKAVSVDKELFYFSFPLIFASLAGLITSWTDTLMLGFFLTASDVGIYNAALPTAKLLRVFPGSFGAIFMPIASELYSRNAIGELKNTYSVVTKWIISLVFPAFLLMLLFSEEILEIIFGLEFVAGAGALSILAFGYLITCIIGPASLILQAYGRTGIVMCCSFVGATLNFGLNYSLIPLYGVNGAAIATGISFAFIDILQLFFVYKIGKLQPFRTIYAKPVFASGLAVLAIYAVTKYMIGVTLFSLIGMFIVFLALYFFLLFLMKSFEKEDLMIMRAIDQRLGTRSNWVREIIRKFL